MINYTFVPLFKYEGNLVGNIIPSVCGWSPFDTKEKEYQNDPDDMEVLQECQ